MIPDEAVRTAWSVFGTAHITAPGMDEMHAALTAACPAIRRQVLTEVIAGIRAEDWWTPDGGSEYEIGDHDGKVRVIGWLDDLIAEIDGAG